MQEPVSTVQMPRRAFLAWGSALFAGALQGKALDAPKLHAAVSEGALPEAAVRAGRISVGYGVPLLADTSDLMEACSLASGDAEFIRRGARISIFGLDGIESALVSEGMKSLSLSVAYPVAEGGQPVLVHAWHFVNGPVAHVSPGNSFVVPVEGGSGLNLIVEAEDGAGQKRHAVCRFTIGTEPGLPRLVRGIYALAPSDATVWQGLAWGVGNGPRPRLVRRDLPGAEPVAEKFPGLAMTVDYSYSGTEPCA